jgi:hypothetical protein
MAFKVQVGPVQIAIHQGQTVLVTRPDGQVNWPSARGLYFRDTRVIWLQHTTGRSSLQLYRSDAMSPGTHAWCQVAVATNVVFD